VEVARALPHGIAQDLGLLGSEVHAKGVLRTCAERNQVTSIDEAFPGLLRSN
jgi:hypothetical protein